MGSDNASRVPPESAGDPAELAEFSCCSRSAAIPLQSRWSDTLPLIALDVWEECRSERSQSAPATAHRLLGRPLKTRADTAAHQAPRVNPVSPGSVTKLLLWT